MNKGKSEITIECYIEGESPAVHEIYDQLLKSLKQLGPFGEGN